MKSKTLLIVFATIITLALAGGAYWYFFMQDILNTPVVTPGGEEPDRPGFRPFDRPGTTGGEQPATTTTSGEPSDTTPVVTGAALPVLRLLSSTPVGGYGASTTKATTTVRWVDRGRGNVYEANFHTSIVTTLSNTVVPRVYDSAWNRNLTAFIGSIFQDGDSEPSTIYAELAKRGIAPAATSTGGTAAVAPYELRGDSLPDGVIAYAVSPNRARIFMLIDESGSGVGYTASFNGQNMTKIFTTPVTQANVEWPSDNVIALTTKGTASYGGFLYFIDPTRGTWTKVLGPIAGLSAVVSRDAKNVIYSSTGKAGSLLTSIHSITKGSSVDAVVRTLADKCAWGNFYKDMVYCAVPSQLPSAVYPDAWYTGRVSTSDKVWEVDADTGNVHLLSSIIDQSDRTVDAFNLSLDANDGYLFFMSKNDLSLWSLDLVRAN